VDPSTNKKVVIRRFDREPISGFVNPQTYLKPEGVELLSQDGNYLKVPWDQVKAVDFVRAFLPENNEPDQRFFARRPKMAGLWVRMRFRDGELMEGLLVNNLLHWEPHGFTVAPPNPTSNRQRIFVPRVALVEICVLGVIGSPLKSSAARTKARTEQMRLFE
jgi:hypothetical protein